MSTTQKQVIVEAIKNVLNTNEFTSKVELTSEQRKQVLDIISVQLIAQGTMSTDAMAKYKDAAGIRKEYASGVLNNWLKKAPELNGNVKYEAKNPGSRSKDSTMLEIKKVMAYAAQIGDADLLEQAIIELDKRTAELKHAKAKVEKMIEATDIDMSVIPASLIEQIKANS
jgi:hypothetical protein